MKAGSFTILAVALTISPPEAHAQDVSGTWAVRWAQAVRINRDGTIEIQKWGDARLVLRQDGSRITGEWKTNILEPVTWTVEGTLKGDHLTLTAREHDSDNPQLAQVKEMIWRGTLTDGELEGEMTLVFKGGDGPRSWRPWRARRTG